MPFDDGGRFGPWRGTGDRAINLPPVILWLIGLNLAVHVVRQMSDMAFDARMLAQLGVVAAAYTGDAGPLAVDPLALLVAPFSFQFLHGSWLHLGINMATLVAFGAPVERVLGTRRFLAFYLASGIAAALVHIGFYYDSIQPLIGASGGVSGLFGGVLLLLRRLGKPASVLPIAAVWIGVNVFFGVVGVVAMAGGDSIAWVAHIGGFIFGLATIRFFVPGPVLPLVR